MSLYKQREFWKLCGEMHFELKEGNFEWDGRERESALLLLEGNAQVHFHGESIRVKRKHWKDENPSVFHLSCGDTIRVEGGCRFAIVSTKNDVKFESRFYEAKDISVEHRGKGILNDTCYRLVRTVFDSHNAPKEAKLVLGEVIAFPGRWSSYPPHHHEQEEIYYYEMEPKTGFAFGQCGEDVYRIQDQDLLHIPGGKDHAQVSAPGYTMYYLWAVRHGDTPYTGFEYTKPYDEVLS